MTSVKHLISQSMVHVMKGRMVVKFINIKLLMLKIHINEIRGKFILKIRG